jgi:hypothetical protein
VNFRIQKDRDRAARVVVPGKSHYLLDHEGERLGDCLTALGYRVEVGPLDSSEQSGERLALCCVCSPQETVHMHPDPDRALVELARLRKASAVMLGFAAEAAAPTPFRRAWEISRHLGCDGLIDVGLQSQDLRLLPPMRKLYRFLLAGLTPSEVARARTLTPGEDRPIPWAFVGYLTPHRAALVDRLVQDVHPGGFVYLTGRPPVREEIGRALGRERFENILGRSLFQVWCSRHLSFYLEAERFRMALLAGCVPVKAILAPVDEETGPFPYLLAEPDELAEILDPGRYADLLERLREDYLRLPALADSLAELLGTFGLPADASDLPRPAPIRPFVAPVEAGLAPGRTAA